MRIGLVHPAGSNWVPGKKDITTTANRMAPLGLLSIAAGLEQNGHEVFVHDCLGPFAPSGLSANARRILDLSPDLVGFSTTTSSFPDGYALAALIKKARPQIKTVFGGVHVSSMGAVLLKQFKHIDFMCVGEGENTFAELAEGRESETIKGLIFRDGEDVVTNPPRDRIKDLDELPFPAYEKLAGFPKKYELPLFSYILAPGATMVTSRGCPYRCSFCDRSVFKQIYHYNSAEYVYEHMRHLKERFGVRHINIYDDLFTTNRERILDLCGRLTSKPLDIQFNCAVRVGHADDELLNLLKEAGCLQISVGIETGDANLMQDHKAGVKLEEVADTVKRIKHKNLRIKGLFIMGLPGETEETIRRTSDLAVALKLDDMNLSKFTPFYGAPIWAEVYASGRLDNDWKKMNCLNFVYVPEDIESKERLDELYNKHVKRFYSDPAWRRRLRKRFWQHRRSFLRLLQHLPTFLAAKRNFEPGQHKE